MEQYKCKGTITFAYSKEHGLMYYTHDYESDMEKDMFGEKLIYDLISGKEFIEMIDDHFITDYDGSLSEIFLDGYVSNLGIAHEDFEQGKFLMDKEMFLEVCDKFKVEVNWANK